MANPVKLARRSMKDRHFDCLSLYSIKWKNGGIINAIGVHIIHPLSASKTSNLPILRIPMVIVPTTINILTTFSIIYFFVEERSGQHLKKFVSRIRKPGYSVTGYTIIILKINSISMIWMYIFSKLRLLRII
jgi:hypothetical protein